MIIEKLKRAGVLPEKWGLHQYLRGGGRQHCCQMLPVDPEVDEYCKDTPPEL